MVRNLTQGKRRPWRPPRVWTKKTGPGEESRITRAISAPGMWNASSRRCAGWCRRTSRSRWAVAATGAWLPGPRVARRAWLARATTRRGSPRGGLAPVAPARAPNAGPAAPGMPARHRAAPRGGVPTRRLLIGRGQMLQYEILTTVARGQTAGRRKRVSGFDLKTIAECFEADCARASRTWSRAGERRSALRMLDCKT